MSIQYSMKKALLHSSTALDSAKTDAPSMSYEDYLPRSTALSAANSILVWAETSSEDLDEGETLSDRLFALLVGIVDENQNGELDDDEQEYFDEVRDYAQQYLERLGVDSDDALSLLEDWDDDAAERVHDIVLANLPDGDDDDISFVFGNPQTLDSATKPRLSRPIVTFVNGVKTFKRKILGKVVLSAKQKAALVKARLKSHTGAALRKRNKSMKNRRKAGY